MDKQNHVILTVVTLQAVIIIALMTFNFMTVADNLENINQQIKELKSNQPILVEITDNETDATFERVLQFPSDIGHIDFGKYTIRISNALRITEMGNNEISGE